MTCLFGKLKPARAALLLGWLLLGPPAFLAAGESKPILSFNRADQDAAPPVKAVAPPTEAASPPAESGSSERSSRLLAPPSRRQIASPSGARVARSQRVPSFALPKMESFGTAGAGLGIVVGLFLVCMWLLRRSGPKPTSPLPTDAVQVLGRVPLAGRNFAHLLRLGNKLVLVAITPEGVSPIAEITEPLEVQRLLGLCMGSHKSSTSAEFQSVLEKLAQEPASGFLGNQAAASYASQSR